MGLLDRVLGRQREPAAHETYTALRSQILGASIDSLGGAGVATDQEVVLALMEWNLDGNVVTVVAVADGTVSLYFSNGGGVIGAGAHDGPRRAAERFIQLAAANRALLSATQSAPLPAAGRTRFHLRTRSGALAADASTNELGEGRHALSPLFYAAQDVITAIRTAPPSPDAG